MRDSFHVVKHVKIKPSLKIPARQAVGGLNIGLPEA